MGDRSAKDSNYFRQNPYRSSVLIHNWQEDLCAEESKIYNLVADCQSGSSEVQRTSKFLTTVLQPINLTTNLDGFLHDGDIIMLKCCHFGQSTPVFLASLPTIPTFYGPEPEYFKSTCAITATKNPGYRLRTAFIVYRIDNRIPNNAPIMFGENISIQTLTAAGSLKLHTETRSFLTFSKKSNNQEVGLVREASARIQWKVLYKDPKFRMEMEGHWVPVNRDVIINSTLSNRNLALEDSCTIKTIFGTEYEVSANTYTDVHKVETSQNVWQFVGDAPVPSKYNTAIDLPNQKRIDPHNIDLVIPSKGTSHAGLSYAR